MADNKLESDQRRVGDEMQKMCLQLGLSHPAASPPHLAGFGEGKE